MQQIILVRATPLFVPPARSPAIGEFRPTADARTINISLCLPAVEAMRRKTMRLCNPFSLMPNYSPCRFRSKKQVRVARGGAMARKGKTPLMARQSAQRLSLVAVASTSRVNLGWLGDTVGYHLRIAQEASFQAFARRANNADARPWLFAILALIDSNPGITQGDLAAAIGRKTSTMTPALNALVRRGHVTRKRLKADRRTYALKLTSPGRVAMLELKAAAVEHERELDRLVGPRNRPEFKRILQRIADGLTATDVD